MSLGANSLVTRYCTVCIKQICFTMNIHIDGKILPLLIANPYIIGNNTQKSKVKGKLVFQVLQLAYF
jgi:hypothetical protein